MNTNYKIRFEHDPQDMDSPHSIWLTDGNGWIDLCLGAGSTRQEASASATAELTAHLATITRNGGEHLPDCQAQHDDEEARCNCAAK
jgi:hypothetical protein